MFCKYKFSKIILIFSFAVFPLLGIAQYSDEDFEEYEDVAPPSQDFSKGFDFGGSESPPGGNPSGPDEPIDNNPDGPDEPIGAPIDNYLLSLAAGGVLLGYCISRRRV